MSPNLIGYKKFDLYEATTKPHGDLAKAKQELAACGQPNGFTNLAYSTDSPASKAAAAAEQQALSAPGSQ